MSTDKGYLVLTAVGPDRPGIVSELSALIHRAGSNLEDSRMAVLGGEFALLLLVSGSEDALSRTEAHATEQQDALGLRILHERTTGPRTPADVLPYRIRVSGFDRPGIVQVVTSVVARRAVNLRALESRLEHAAESGTPLFVLDAELEVPSPVVWAELSRELTAACDEENLDLTVEARA